jgi:protein tyrosine phosphatase (PTP) superfamily phosphohydrolase (DUF442 family)
MFDAELHQIMNFLAITPTIATAGQPTATQFATVQQAGYQVVVNLAPPTAPDALADEATIVATHSLDYVHIPVVWEAPTLADFEQFVAVMQTYSDRPIFVHCARNMRVSAFLYLYRQLFLSTPEVIARRDLQRIWQPDDRWQAFLDRVLEYYRSSEVC